MGTRSRIPWQNYFSKKIKNWFYEARRSSKHSKKQQKRIECDRSLWGFRFSDFFNFKKSKKCVFWVFFSNIHLGQNTKKWHFWNFFEECKFCFFCDFDQGDRCYSWNEHNDILFFQVFLNYRLVIDYLVYTKCIFGSVLWRIWTIRVLCFGNFWFANASEPFWVKYSKL